MSQRQKQHQMDGKSKGLGSAFNLPCPSGFPSERARLPKLLTNTGLIKPQHTLQNRWPPYYSAEGARSIHPCHQETQNGEGDPALFEVQPFMQSPFFHWYHQMMSLYHLPSLLPESWVHTEEAMWKSRSFCRKVLSSLEKARTCAIPCYLCHIPHSLYLLCNVLIPLLHRLRFSLVRLYS